MGPSLSLAAPALKWLFNSPLLAGSFSLQQELLWGTSYLFPEDASLRAGPFAPGFILVVDLPSAGGKEKCLQRRLQQPCSPLCTQHRWWCLSRWRWSTLACRVQSKTRGFLLVFFFSPWTKPMSGPWIVTRNNHGFKGDLKLSKISLLCNTVSVKEIFFLTLIVIH